MNEWCFESAAQMVNIFHPACEKAARIPILPDPYSWVQCSCCGRARKALDP